MAESVARLRVTTFIPTRFDDCVRRRRRRPSKACDGFTFVELLAVLAVIGVLVALLLPAVSVARRRAMAVACASNLRQIGQAFHLYANENRGRLPATPFVPGARGGPTTQASASVAEPYAGFSGWWPWDVADETASKLQRALSGNDTNTKSRSVFFCPTQRQRNGQSPAPDDAEWSMFSMKDPTNGQRRFYRVLSYALFVSRDYRPASVNHFDNGMVAPATMKKQLTGLAADDQVLAADGVVHTPFDGPTPEPLFPYTHGGSWIVRGAHGPPIIANHWDARRFEPEGGNVLSVDGSVRWLRLDQMTPRWNAGNGVELGNVSFWY